VTEPILSVEYWAKRLRDAPLDAPHHAVFKCDLARWRRIEAKHREILARHVGRADSVLDAGCGWGRLLDLMPAEWAGLYRGVDISPDFIAKAEQEHPGRSFLVGDLRRLPPIWGRLFDWAVLISVRPMVRRNCGDEVWAQMERELRRVAKRLLLLEYDENDEGSVE
jgi:trans-aconitate methyltransferase